MTSKNKFKGLKDFNALNRRYQHKTIVHTIIHGHIILAIKLIAQ